MAACGTNAGYGRHRRMGEKPCPQCRAAHSRLIQAWKVQHGETAHVQVRAEVLSAVLTGDIDVLRMALGPEMVTALENRAALVESRRRRDAEVLAAVVEVVERLDPPPDSEFDAAWAAIHNDPALRDSADAYIH